MHYPVRKLEMTTISIAKDFSRYPAGRYTSKGHFSGERFRKEYILPVLNDDRELTIIMDGTVGYGSSFLEEAFGGLIREGFELEYLKEKLKLVAEDADFEIYPDEAWEYILEAEARQAN